MHIMSNVEKRKKLAAMLRGNDAMKNNMFIKLNRIALISIAVATLMACSSLTAFAAQTTSSETSQPVMVTYNGSGTTVAVDYANNLDTFRDLMPNSTTKAQKMVIRNNSSKQMQAYFRAVPAAADSNTEITASLLDTLILKVTFVKEGTTTEQVLYEGPASGKTQTTPVQDIVTAPISLGYLYGNSTSGVISATLTAPETMGNQFQLASAKITWEFQFQGANPSSSGGGGGNGGGGGTVSDTSSQPPESIGTESTPQGGPVSSTPAAETIVNGDVPLSNPPKTGENPALQWGIVALAVTAGFILVMTKRKIRMDSNK